MFELITKLHNLLNAMKGFESGYSSENKKEMLIKHKNKVYKVSLEELGEGEIIDHINKL